MLLTVTLVHSCTSDWWARFSQQEMRLCGCPATAGQSVCYPQLRRSVHEERVARPNMGQADIIRRPHGRWASNGWRWALLMFWSVTTILSRVHGHHHHHAPSNSAAFLPRTKLLPQSINQRLDLSSSLVRHHLMPASSGRPLPPLLE